MQLVKVQPVILIEAGVPLIAVSAPVIVQFVKLITLPIPAKIPLFVVPLSGSEFS